MTRRRTSRTGDTAIRAFRQSPEFAQLAEQQGGACAICRATDKPLNVDHDHRSGAIRGLLCSACNAGLGLFGDNPGRIAVAATYLRAQPIGWLPGVWGFTPEEHVHINAMRRYLAAGHLTPAEFLDVVRLLVPRLVAP